MTVASYVPAIYAFVGPREMIITTDREKSVGAQTISTEVVSLMDSFKGIVALVCLSQGSSKFYSDLKYILVLNSRGYHP